MQPWYRPRSRRLRWFLAYLAATAALMVIGLCVQAVTDPGPKGPPFPAAVPTPHWAQPPFPVNGAASPTAPAPAAGGARPLAVVAGRRVVNGVELGFPHSTAGAVSAAADTAGEVFSTLDPDRAAAVMRLTADPSYADAPQQAAQGAASDRQALGVPPAGPVPDGYSLVAQPAEYQLRDVTAGSVLVLLLSDLTTTQPGDGTQARVAVFPFPMRWDAGDWKAADPGGASYLSLAAEPFSPQAAALGWHALVPRAAALGWHALVPLGAPDAG